MGILILHGMSFASRRSFLCVKIRAGTLSRSASAQSAHLLGFMSGRWSLVQTQALSQCAHPRRGQCYESCSTATSDQGQRHHPTHIANVALPLESHATGKGGSCAAVRGLTGAQPIGLDVRGGGPLAPPVGAPVLVQSHGQPWGTCRRSSRLTRSSSSRFVVLYVLECSIRDRVSCFFTVKF